MRREAKPSSIENTVVNQIVYVSFSLMEKKTFFNLQIRFILYADRIVKLGHTELHPLLNRDMCNWNVITKSNKFQGVLLRTSEWSSSVL